MGSLLHQDGRHDGQPKDKKAYSAISHQGLDGHRQRRQRGDIAWTPPSTRARVRAHLTGGQKDSAGGAINSEWVPTTQPSAGRGPGTADALGNLANADKIANPDNLKFSEKMRTLFIGEDSGMHVNNFLWAYNVDTKTLSRVLSPAGAESTGLHAVDKINGWTYIMSNFQHPGDWESPLHDVVKPRWIR
jgi:hypothetical protein